MALSNLAIFGGAFFTPVSIRSLLVLSDDTGPNICAGNSRKNHSHYRFALWHGRLMSPNHTDLSINRLAMILLFNCNLRGCIAADHFSLRS